MNILMVGFSENEIWKYITYWDHLKHVIIVLNIDYNPFETIAKCSTCREFQIIMFPILGSG